METKSVEMIRQAMEKKTTEELRAIYEEHNENDWTEEAFEAIRLILKSRGETNPIIRIAPKIDNTIIYNVTFIKPKAKLTFSFKGKGKFTVKNNELVIHGYVSKSSHNIITIALFFPLLLLSMIIAGILSGGGLDPGHWSFFTLIIMIVLMSLFSYLLNKVISKKSFFHIECAKIKNVQRNNCIITFSAEHPISKDERTCSVKFDSSSTAEEFVKNLQLGR